MRVALSIGMLLAACAADTPTVEASSSTRQAVTIERDVVPTPSGNWPVAGPGASLSRSPTGELTLVTGRSEKRLAERLIGQPAFNKDRSVIAWSAAEAPLRVGVAAVSFDGEAWSGTRVLAEQFGRPDRVAVSDDGAWVVFVSGVTGFASLWAVPTSGDSEPIQLTNIGLTSDKSGEMPEAFVAPPHRSVPEVSSGQVRWQAPDGEHLVDLPQ